MSEQGSGIHRMRQRFGGVAEQSIEVAFARPAESHGYEPKTAGAGDKATNQALQATSVTPGICGKSILCDRHRRGA